MGQGQESRRDARRRERAARQRQQAWEAVRQGQGAGTSQHTPPVAPPQPVNPTATLPGQQHPGQQHPGQQHPGQQHPGQQHPGKQIAAQQPFPGGYPYPQGQQGGVQPGDLYANNLPQAVTPRPHWPAPVVLVLGLLGGFLLWSAVFAATPLQGDRFEPVLLLSGLLLAGLSLGAALLRGSRRARTSVVVTVGVLAALFSLGALTQTNLAGEAHLRGSVIDRAARDAEEIGNVVRVMNENQRLMSLPAEQLIGLEPVLAEAENQAVLIAATWNPARSRPDDLPELVELVRLVNLTASRQASAFAAFRANLATPATGLQETYAALNAEVEGLLAKDLTTAREALGTTLLEGRDG